MASNTDISKTLSYWLRHRPDAAGLTLDAQGWTSVAPVLAGLATKHRCDWDRLVEVVELNDGQGFDRLPYQMAGKNGPQPQRFRSQWR